MANCSCEKELKNLQNLVVRLAGEIDYKNLILMEMEETNATAVSVLVAKSAEKDTLLGEKSAAITTLTEEKEWLQKEVSKAMKEIERLANERSAAISVLITQDAEKDKLLEEKSAAIAALTEENERQLKEMSKARNPLKVKEERMDYEYVDVTSLRAQIAEKDSQINEKSAIISSLTAEKDRLLEACLKELEAARNMKLEHEKLQYDLECQKEETLTAKQKLKMKEERMDYESDSIATLIQQNAEKDRLINEKSTVISNLMAEKDQWFEAYLRELEKNKSMKPENAMLEHDLKCQKEKPKRLIKEKNDMVQEDVAEKVVCCFEPSSSEPGLQMKEFKDSKVQTEEEQDPSMGGIEQVETQCLREHDEDMKAQLDILRKELEAKREELSQTKSLNQTLILKEPEIIEELQAARVEAVNCLLTMDGNRTKIGIKRMGEIDPQPFRDACSKKFCGENWEEKFDELYSSWKENLNDASWNPFKKEIISGKLSVVVEKNDKRRAELRKEWGKEAYGAVIDTLVDLNEYNPGLRYSIPEIWNLDEGRRVHLKEVIQYLFQQWETLRNKDTEQSVVIIDLMAERLIKRLTNFDILLREKDKLLPEKYAAIGKLTAEDVQKVKQIDKLTAKNDVLLGTCNAEKRKTRRLQQEVQMLTRALQSQKEELGKQTKKLPARNRNNYEAVEMNMESKDQVEPLPKNLEAYKTQKFEEQNGSSSEDKMLEDQKMRQSNKALEVELDMLRNSHLLP